MYKRKIEISVPSYVFENNEYIPDNFPRIRKAPFSNTFFAPSRSFEHFMTFAQFLVMNDIIESAIDSFYLSQREAVQTFTKHHSHNALSLLVRRDIRRIIDIRNISFDGNVVCINSKRAKQRLIKSLKGIIRYFDDCETEKFLLYTVDIIEGL